MADVKLRAFVCGHPVAHSRSPLIHSYWLEEHGIVGSYEIMDVTADKFANFIVNIGDNGFIGGNITIPHKEAASHLVGRIDEAAERIGAVNTVWLERKTLCGANTDWSGFTANLDDRASGWERSRHAVILGAGGSARAVLYALVMRGIPHVTIVNRTLGRADTMAREFGGWNRSAIETAAWENLPGVLADADLLVNTTSLWMESADAPVPGLGSLSGNAVVTDIVYMPLQTPLLAAAAALGLRTVDGLGMLLHQAAPGFEKWFGIRPEVTTELRDLIVRDMENRG